MIQTIDIEAINNAEDKDAFNYDKMFSDCFINLDEVIERPPIALSIGEYTYDNKQYPNPTYTYGEFSATVAPSKTKKSFFKSALIASYIGGEQNDYFPSMRSHRESDWYIVDVDTEQGKFYAQHVFRRVLKMTGGNYANYLPFSMRSKTPKERVQFVDALLEDEKYKGKIKFISIDGIADLVENTNDIVMSNEIASKVLKWTDEYGAHLHTVIHKLMGVDKPTGHLGSYILKKAETVVFLEKEKNAQDIENDDVIIVKNKYSRGRSFEDFSFSIDSDGLPFENAGYISNPKDISL